jgi:2-polyprenyl-6-methoxyphenol hydroxylase-like FAD-dependent oxidoreductase
LNAGGEAFDTQVLIVGAGPVGLVAAMDLSRRGIKVIVVETRHVGEPPPVKCNHVAARSMEIFRRLGVAEAVRAAGLPDDYPNDVVFLTTATGQEIGRVRIPSRAERALADGRAAAPHQPDLPRADPVRPRAPAAGGDDPQPHPA